ncbi:glycosyltransferase [Gaoshiqia sediminis]|uniref:Uncharacterized protein n=1 Tax=Gaoshiqia sediminis TaxID=2986998 RepID=A0AA41Y5U0_9BACT|nr:hypothetical protein [Gaoshiqia sediminis]MCW0481672.1 hypothetical protein [Gaoshiqia sediminis]
MPAIIIDPTVNIQYSSFYIKGLEIVFGKVNVRFSSKYFKSLKRQKERNSYEHYMAFVLVDKDCLTKYVIDFRDKVEVKESAYDWCDKYAKINYHKRYTGSRFSSKMISIPPGFGIRIWGLWETIFYGISNFAKCNFSPVTSGKQFFADYFLLYLRRLPIEGYSKNDQLKEYESMESKENYVFFISTLWPHENCLKTTNVLRKHFIETCKNFQFIDFEGGFYANSSHPQYEEFKQIVFTKPYSVKSYLDKTKASLFVFNTPSVHNCHGWKLGEFLAMGKAIISTPLSNELPEALVHGKNIHIISDFSKLEETVRLIVKNKKYRQHLEVGAKAYYLKYVKPESVIRYILNY